MPLTEKSIREHIKHIIPHCCGRSNRVLLVEELELGFENSAARIDMALVGEYGVGIEIKGPKDTLIRLPRQMEVFSQYFDYMLLVADQSHVDAAEELLPPWWGVIEIHDLGPRSIYRQRRACQQNPSPDISALARLLWKSELMHLAEKYSCSDTSKRHTKSSLQDLLVRSVSKRNLRQDILSMIRSRRDWRATPVVGI